MHRIVELALANRILVILVVCLAVVAGSFALKHLTIDAVPDITNVQVQILTKSPALGPVEIEQFITYPVEAAMNGLPRLAEIRSVSRYGISSVTVIFEENVDIYFARQLVSERLNTASEAIPENLGRPALGPLTTGLGEIYQFTVEGEGYTPMELRTILDWEIAYRLRSVPGVVEVNTWGGKAQQYHVLINPQSLIAYRLSLASVFEALEKNNANVGSGYVERNQEQYIIRGEALISSIHDIENIVVGHNREGVPVFVRNLGTVEKGSMLRIGAATEDGRRETVIGLVQMLAGANAREVVERVKAEAAKIQTSLPPGVAIRPFYDRAQFVDRVLRTVTVNLMEGGLLVIAVLFVLLGSFRGGLVVALAIPLSMLFAFIGMYYLGISGNLMSLGAIDFGLIVDGSVVMMENILRKRSENPETPILELARQGGREVARPVFYAVLIITLVYLPILALTGTEGKLFRPMAITVIFALLGSLIVAMTVVPVLASFLFKKKPRGAAKDHETWLVRLTRRRYTRVLQWTMDHRGATALLALAVLAVTLFLGWRLGTEFVPELDEGDIVINALRLPSVSMSESVASSLMIERVLKQFPEVALVVSRTGSPEVATDLMGIELSDIFITLKPRNQWTTAKTKEELIEKMEDRLAHEIPGVGISFTQPIEMRFNELVAGVRSDIGVKVFGDDLDVLKSKADQVVRVLSSISGAADVKAEQVAGLPMARIVVDRNEIARYGINASEVLDAVEAIRAGRNVGTIYEGRKRFDLVARFTDAVSKDLESLSQIPAGGSNGQQIPLGQLAKLEYATGPAQISREQIQRRIVVESNVRGRDLGGFVREARARVGRDVKLDPGYYLEWGGQFENLQRASARLMLVVPLTLALIFSLLYFAFKSAKVALIIFLNIPFAATGGVFALALRGMPFSISAAVGFIALFGVAVLNGVVLLSYVRSIQESGKPAGEAAYEGAQVRYRPVMLTALVASLGFIPMALSHGMGAEVQRPLATVVIGGLITSTALTLLVLPTVYAWVFRARVPSAFS
ncbi:MAG: CusA/CzcA family heavy metal efflux RND transporter [Acidobacteria bacterium]|nr:CusA/CzcA family heavy metal efflux RND transporter [Acidobacteriota bacterium]